MSLEKLQEYSTVKEDTILQYIHSLYCIELLRNANIQNVDLQLAYQYGAYYQTPWRNNKSLILKFLKTNPHILRKFTCDKYNQLISDLFTSAKNFCPLRYHKTPLEPNMKNSIRSCMENMMNETTMWQALMTEKEFKNSNTNSHIRNHSNAFSEIELVDRLLCGVFDMFVTNGDLSFNDPPNKEKFGASRKELLDNKVYMCHKKLHELIRSQMNSQSMYNNYNAWASILSIMFRMVIPKDMHPNRLDRMYEKYVLRHEGAPEAIQYARKFSSLSAESVVTSKRLPVLNCHYADEEALRLGHAVTYTYPNSVIEHYLVTRYLTNKTP